MAVQFMSVRKTGRARTGYDPGGTIIHALAPGSYLWSAALCGTKPGRAGGGWSTEPGAETTCARCASKVKRFK